MGTFTIGLLLYWFAGAAYAWPNDEGDCKLGIETDCIIHGAQDYMHNTPRRGANFFKFGCDWKVEAACLALACSKSQTCQDAATLNKLEPLCETKKSAAACAVLAYLGPDFGFWIKKACLLGGQEQCTSAVNEADDIKELREILEAACQTHLFANPAGRQYCLDGLRNAAKKNVDEDIKRHHKRLCDLTAQDCEKFVKRLRDNGKKAAADRQVAGCVEFRKLSCASPVPPFMNEKEKKNAPLPYSAWP